MTAPKKISLPALTALTFAGSFVAAKYTALTLQPLTTTFFRYIIALLFLSLLLIRYKPSSLKVSVSELPRLFLLGLTGIVGYHYFFFSSLKYTTVANSAVINAFNPALTAAAAAIFIRERLSWRNYIGLVLAMFGVMALITHGSLSNLLSFNFNRGDLLMLCAVLSWVIYSLIVKTISSRYSGFTITFYAALFGVVQLSFLTMTENISEQIRQLSTSTVLAVLYMGIVASGLGYLLYNLSIAHIGPTKTSSFVYSLVPIFVVALAALFFAEKITILIALCTVLVIVGLYFLARENKQIEESSLGVGRN